MSWNNTIPYWLLGNPYGPLPDHVGGGYYWIDEPKDIRHGPFKTMRDARDDMKKEGYGE